MKHNEALEIVTRAAGLVEGIRVDALHAPRQGLVLHVTGGRRILVQACQPTHMQGIRYNTTDDLKINRVVIRAGRHVIVRRRQLKEDTRTFRVLTRGGLNEAGIAKALREMAASQVQDEEWKARNAEHAEKQVAAKRKIMRKVNGLTEGALRSRDGKKILDYGRMSMAGLEAQIQVNDVGTVTVNFRLTVEEFEQLLERLR